MFLFVHSDTSAVSFSHKKHHKNESKKTRAWVFLRPRACIAL